MLPTYTIRLSGHVEAASLELAEVFEENGDKSSNILGGFRRIALEASLSILMSRAI